MYRTQRSAQHFVSVPIIEFTTFLDFIAQSAAASMAHYHTWRIYWPFASSCWHLATWTSCPLALPVSHSFHNLHHLPFSMVHSLFILYSRVYETRPLTPNPIIHWAIRQIDLLFCTFTSVYICSVLCTQYFQNKKQYKNYFIIGFFDLLNLRIYEFMNLLHGGRGQQKFSFSVGYKKSKSFFFLSIY